jgi:hypothetical protein
MQVFAAVTLAALVTGTSALNTTVPFEYPLYGQCDEKWGDDMMDTKTICDVGCLMSSTAMALAGSSIPIRGEVESTPKTLNQWLKHNDGYEGNNLVEEQVPLIDPERIVWPADGMHREKDLSYATIVEYLTSDPPRIVIGNVNNGSHFVLITGYSDEDHDTFVVNDPGYHKDQYSYKSDVVGFRLFDMVR